MLVLAVRQSYWAVADSRGWFGEFLLITTSWSQRSWSEFEPCMCKISEQHARDSFENLLFSICRFRELTGTYPKNITVTILVSYDFKQERFANLHRSAIGFPESRFFYEGTSAASNAKAATLKGEALVRAQFQNGPFGCQSSLYHKKLRRDPFHRSIPYPNGCPEMQALFGYCGPAPYPGSLTWA